MTIQRICGLSVLLTAIALSGGCSSLKAKSDSSAPAPDSGTTTQSDVSVGGANLGGVDSSALNDPRATTSGTAAKLAQAGLDAAGMNVVRFPYDSDALSSADMSLLRKHAAFMKANPSVAVRLEGHADERGTQEYNLALGERRAKAVAVFLQGQSVKAGQLEVISYGELKPVAEGEDEASWAQNRRVEIIYR